MRDLRKIRAILLAFFLYLFLFFEQNSNKYAAQMENSLICEAF